MAVASVMLAFFFAGATLAYLEKQNIAPDRVKLLIDHGEIRQDQPVEVTGVLLREPEAGPNSLYFQLDVEQIKSRSVEIKASGVVALIAHSTTSTSHDYAQLSLRYGARIRVMTRLERTNNFRNPGVSQFTDYLDSRGFDAGAAVKSPLLIERLDDERVFVPLALLFDWRRTLQNEIDSHFDTTTAGVLDAALLGNRYRLSYSTSERFREGGTFHVLVISGLHITFLGGLIFFVMRQFTRNRLAQFFTSVSVVWGYSFAVGAEPTVVRAALMFTVVILAPLLSRRATSLNALGGVVIALLVWQPGDIFNPSFQLTFASVLAIVVLAWPLLEKMAAIGRWRPTREEPYPPICTPWLKTFCESLFWSERKGKLELSRLNHSYKLFKSPLCERFERVHLQVLLRYAVGAIVVSIAVQIALLPFLIIYFHRFSLASFVLNVGVSLLMAAVAICALCALMVAQFSATLAMPLVSAVNCLNWLMVHSVDPFTSAGVASFRVPEYSGNFAAVYLAYYVPLILLARALAFWNPLALRPLGRKRRRQTIVVAIAQFVLITLVLFHPFSASRQEGKLRIDFLDVGQGDAALVTLPAGTTVLIDGGGNPGPFRKTEDGEFERDSRSIGETVVSEYLWRRGLDHVDYLIATHADADHIDGLNDVARNFGVRAVLVARTPNEDAQFAHFNDTLNSRQIPLRVIGAGDTLQIGKASMEVLWPTPSNAPGLPSGNNESLVLRVRYGERSFLFSGDIEKTAESNIFSSGRPMRSDVVKVPHHGSKTSSTDNLIAATHPHFAVISVGRSSMFGHPHGEVVERWKASGAKVMTTGAGGMITFVTDGRELEVETFAKD